MQILNKPDRCNAFIYYLLDIYYTLYNNFSVLAQLVEETMKIMKQTLLALLSLCFFVSTVSALGVGSYQVNSFLNEPLEVEVPLTDTAGIDPSDLKVSLAHEFYFQLSKVQQKPIHNALDFDIRDKEGQLYLYITSRQPVTDSFLKFITQFNWSNGRLLKEFTVLLDPPKFSDPITADSITPGQTLPSTVGGVSGVDSSGLSQQEVVVLPPAPIAPAPVAPAPVYVPAPAPAPVPETYPMAETFPVTVDEAQTWTEAETWSEPAETITYESEPYIPQQQDLSVPPSMRGGSFVSSFDSAPVYSAPSVPASMNAPSVPASMGSFYQEPAYEASYDDDYAVEKGDTLWEISQRVAPSMNPQKTSLAILDNNPNAFINGNIHQLRADVNLDIPSIDEIQSISLARARKAFEVQDNPILDDNETQLTALEVDSFAIDDIETGLGEVQIATGNAPTSEETALTNASDTPLTGVLKDEELARINSENQSISEKVTQYEKAIEEGNQLITAQNTSIAELEKQLADARLAKENSGIFKKLLDNLPMLLGLLLIPLLVILGLLYLANKKRKDKAAANVLKFEDLENELSSEFDESKPFDVLHEVENLLAIDDKDAAIEILEAQLMINPEREDYRFKLAQIFWANKNIEGFRKVAAPLNNSSDMAMRNRVDVLATQLGISSFSAEEPEVAPTTESILGSEDDLAGFDFGDLDNDDIESESVEADVVESIDESIEASIAESDSIDVDMDMDIEPEVEESDSIDADSFEDAAEDIDFDLDFDEIDADLDADLDIEAPIDAVAEEDEDMSFDSEEFADTEVEDEMISDPLLSSANDNDGVDVEVKLDLAEAYIDMGDKEGALEILNEIIGLGSDAEQKRIRQLIEKC